MLKDSILHHLEYMTSSKDLENLETSLRARIIALKTGFCHRNLCVDSGTLPEITVCEHSSPCHPQMPVKALTGKEDTLCEYDCLGQSSFKMD